jgi:hypothetical protein
MEIIRVGFATTMPKTMEHHFDATGLMIGLGLGLGFGLGFGLDLWLGLDSWSGLGSVLG